ncbi:MAG: S9 family peptidase [Fimbriimonadaceae bacterium]|nr:S9 family peptidase [Fimbriimonadaceae bacterium]
MQRSFFLAAVIAVAATAVAQLPEPKGFSIRRLTDYPLVQGSSPSGAAMSPDGRHIVFSWNKTGQRMKDTWVVDFPDGEPRQIVASKDIPRFPMQEDKRTALQKEESELYDGGIGGYRWSPDSKEIMFSYRGRTWLMKPDGSGLHALFDTQEQVGGAQYSPDGKAISFTRGGDVYRYDRATGHVTQLTFLPNGQSVGGVWWSPDSKTLAVQWQDSSRIGRHVMMDFTKDRAEVVNISRGWLGEMGQNVQVGFVPATGGAIKFVPGIPRYTWITDAAWSPDSRRFAFFRIDESFQKATIAVCNPATALRYDCYEEKAPKNYIPDFRKLDWTRDSSKILFTTDILDGKFGYRSLLAVDPAGQHVEKVYAKDHDIAGFMRPKDSDRIVLATLARNPLYIDVTVLEPDGKTTTHTVYEDGVTTPAAFDDATMPLVSDDGTKMASLASNPTINSELFALEPKLKRITTSQSEDFKKIEWADVKQVSFPGPDGATIYGTLFTKKGLDTSKKHPAFLSNMYANSARASWGGYIENYAATELDMVVLKVNFRASWGQGGEFNSGYAKSMGIIDTQEAVAAKKYLVSLGYVDPDRCGVWGWSYGGFLTDMIMLSAPGEFDTGVAVASVTNWKSYNEWYTRRRLGLPKDNEEVYKKTSPISYAKGLKGNLFLIHGMLDDNVLFQDVVQLTELMIREDKHFDEFFFPRSDHGISRVHERPLVWEKLLGYLYTKLNRPKE